MQTRPNLTLPPEATGTSTGAVDTTFVGVSAPSSTGGIPMSLAPVSADVYAGLSQPQGITGGTAAPAAPVATVTPPRPRPHEPAPISPTFHTIKTIGFLGRQVPVLCQNENGPCPLLAACNVLLLRGHLTLPQSSGRISAESLIQLIGMYILEHNPPPADPALAVNQQQTINDVLATLPSMLVGLDVNVRFKGVKDFEYTRECAIFDVLDISLYHGWILDESDVEVASAVGHLSYNQLVELQVGYIEKMEAAAARVTAPRATPVVAATVVSDDACLASAYTAVVDESAPAPSSVVVGTVIPAPTEAKRDESTDTSLAQGYQVDKFLRASASQLTYEGLMTLHRDVKERELSVFFRNNHFCTMFKYEGRLFLLVTDLGYASQPTIVWECLDSVDGDTTYVDANFKCPPPAASLSAAPSTPADPDYLLALALSQQQSPHPAAAPAAAATDIPLAPPALAHTSSFERELAAHPEFFASVVDPSTARVGYADEYSYSSAPPATAYSAYSSAPTPAPAPAPAPAPPPAAFVADHTEEQSDNKNCVIQ